MRYRLPLLLGTLLVAFLNFSAVAQPTISCPDVTTVSTNGTNLGCGGCTQLQATPVSGFQPTTYNVQSIPYNPYSYTTGTPVILGIDDRWSGVINLPFNFCFYGNTYNQAVIGSNGVVSFNVAQANGFFQWQITQGIPGNPDVLNAICAPFHDTDPAVGGVIRHQVYGTAPCRVFVVSFNQIPMFQCNNLISTQQIAIYETTNIIETYIQNKPTCTTWNAGAAIHGIQNATGTAATVVPGRNFPTQWTATNDARRFVPAGPQNFTVSWFQMPNTLISNTDTVTVCPQTPTDYYAEVVYTNCDNSTVTVRDTVSITVATANINPNQNVTNSNCANDSTGAITTAPTGGTAPYTFNWSNGANTQNISNLPPGTYVVTITDDNGCANVDSFVVAAPTAITTNITPTTIACNGGNNGSATANPNGGTPGYTYTWSTTPVQNTQTATNLGPGTYTVTVTDANGCEDTASVTITEPTAVSTTTSFTQPLCSGGSSATATVNPSGGTPGYTYQWSTTPVQNTQTATNLTSGTYTVTVTDANGCADTATVTVTSPGAITAIVNQFQTVSCFGANDGWAVVNVSGGTPPYTYLWSTTPVQTVDSAVGLGAGLYTVIVTDSNGCMDTTTVTITEPLPLVVLDTGINVSCPGNDDGCAFVNVTGGHGNYGISWSNGGTTDTICSLPPGTYTVTVTDTFYSSVNGQVVYVEDFQGPPTWNLNVPTGANGVDNNFWVINDNEGGVPPPGCGVTGNGDATLHITSVFNPNGGAAYDAGGFCGTLFCPETNMRAESPVFSTAGFSNLTLSFEFIANGQALLDNASVWYNDGLGWTQLVASIKSNVCVNTQGEWTAFSVALPAVLNNNPNVQIGFNWTNNDDGVGTDPSVAINNIRVTTQPPPATFTVCTVIDSVTITEPAPLAVTFTTTDLLCNGDSSGCIVANVTGGNGAYGYAWSTGDTVDSICGLPAGMYYLTITDTSSILSGGAMDTVYTEDFEGALTWTLNVPTGVNGVDNNFWQVDDDEGGVAPPGCGVGGNGDETLHITSVFNPNGGAAYDAGGLCGILFCPETNMRAESPVFSSVGHQNMALSFDFIANGQGLLDNASVWINDGTGWVMLNPSIKSNVCVNAQGEWTNLVIPLPPNMWNNPTCQIGFNWTNNDDGVGTDPSVAINNIFVTSVSLSSTPVVCTLVDSVEITEPPALVLGITGYDVTCNGSADGAAAVTVAGGVTPYTITWNTTATGDSISGLNGGTYTAVVVDSNGCADSISVIINEPPPIVYNFNTVDVLCAGDSNGCAAVNVTGGTGGFTYLWSTGDTIDSICGLPSGTYVVTITDTAGGGGTTMDTLFTELFNASTAWTLNVPTGANGVDNNFWVVNDNEGGVAPPGCGVAGNGDATLHITSVFNPNGGAAYDAGGLCGVLFCPETNRRSESPVFSTVGYQNISIEFEYIANGDALLDNASVWYNDGTGWQVLVPSIKSLVCVNTQGQWTAATFAMPASTFNNPTVQVGFNWTNNDDGVGTDPSVAINDLFVTGTMGGGGLAACSIIDSVVVNEPAPLALDSTVTGAACQTPSGTATVNVQGGVPPYTYAWNTTPVQNTATAVNLLPGNYQVVVTDSNGCQDSLVAVVQNIPGPTVNVTGSTNVSCFGGNDGTATALTTGGTQPVTLAWSTTPVQTTNVATGLTAGTYTVIATDANGCMDTASVMITEPTALTLTLAAATATCNLPNGSATATPGGGTPGYNYQWSNGQNTPVATGLPGGFASVTVTDANGCQIIDSINVGQAGSPSLSIVNTINVLCNGGNDGEATVTAQGGTPPYTFSWNTTPVQNGPVATNLFAGTYIVTVTDDNGCQDTISVTITEPPALGGTVVTTDVGCQAIAPNGTAGIVATGGVPPYQYQWNSTPPQNTSFATGLSPGTYTVTVTDANGCQYMASGTVGQQPSPTVVAGPSVSVCESEGGAMIFATGSGGVPGYYYTWWCDSTNTFCGLDSINDNDPIANPDTSTWYYVQVVDTNGCPSNIDSVWVEVLPKPIVDAGPDIWLCGDSAACVVLQPTITNAAGPYTYLWIPGTGLNDSTILNPCARPDTTTIYALVVTAGNGCSSAYNTTDTLSTITVHVNPVPIAEAGPDIDMCLGDTAQLQGYATGAGPNYTYQWTPSTGLSDTTIAAPFAWPPVTTVYSLVTWSNNCPSYADSVEVRVHTLPTVEAGWDREICLGETTMLDAQAWGDSTATYSFLWTPSAGFVSDTTDEDPFVSPDTTTTYYVCATSNWGCKSPWDSATVYLIPTPHAEAGDNPTICAGDSIALNGSYFYTTTDSANVSQIYYSWWPNVYMTDSTSPNPIVAPPVSMWYYFGVTHRTCTTIDSVFITVNPDLNASVWADTTIICQHDSVQLHSMGGIGGASFTWWPTTGLSDPTVPNPMAAPDTTTTYLLLVEEGGCVDSLSITIEVIPGPEASYLSSLTEGCVPLTVSFMQNTSDAIFYIWDFGDGSPVTNEESPTHTFTQPGTYNVTLTAVNTGGCASTVNDIIVTVHDTANADFTSEPEFPIEMFLPETRVQFFDRSVNALTWAWDFGDGTKSIEENPVHIYDQPGEYFVTLQVNTESGCISRIQHGPYIIRTPDLFIPNVFSPNDDGINDLFQVEYSGSQPFLLQIYDRWGVLIFEERNKYKQWDGLTNKGKIAEAGVYYYLVKVGDREFTGHVTLVR